MLVATVVAHGHGLVCVEWNFGLAENLLVGY